LSGAEDLVPAFDRERSGSWIHDEFVREGYRVTRYRPRIESDIAGNQHGYEARQLAQRGRIRRSVIESCGFPFLIGND
jgi:hypothetical protein